MKDRRITSLTMAGALVLSACGSSGPDPARVSDAATTGDAASVPVDVPSRPAIRSDRGAGAESRMLRAAWPRLQREALVKVSGTGLELVLSNDHADDLFAEVTAATRIDAGEDEVVVAQGLLVQAGAPSTLTIDLTPVARAAAGARTSGRLRVRAVLRDAAGEVRGVAKPEVLSFHLGQDGDLWVYGERVRQERFRGGDLTGRLRGVSPSPGSILLANPAQAPDVEGPAVLAAPPAVTGYRFCFTFDTDFVDGGVGEDYYPTPGPMRAHAIEYEIDHPSWGQPLRGVAALDSGCTVDYVFRETSGFTVRMFAVANLGHSEPDDRTDDHFKVIGILGAGETSYEWQFLDVDPGPGPKVINLKTDPGAMANLMGAAVHTAWLVDHRTFPVGLVNPPNQYVHFYAYPNILCKEGCAVGDHLYLASEAVIAEKFGVSHEVGHWLHQSWQGTTGYVGGQYDDFYNAPVEDFFCTYPASDGPGGHAMRSLEPGSAAFSEGTAHFIAALAWNDHLEEDGVFKYYKESIVNASGQSMAPDGWRVDLEADDPDPALPNPLGGNTAWRNSRCMTANADMPGEAPKYYSTEMDWLRFYWDLATDAPSKHQGAKQPTLRQLFGYLQHLGAHHPWGANKFVAWQNAWAAAQQAEGLGLVPAGFGQRFMAAAALNGVSTP